MTSRRSRALGPPLGAVLASLLCLVLAPVSAHAAASGPTPPSAPQPRTLEAAARAWRELQLHFLEPQQLRGAIVATIMATHVFGLLLACTLALA